MQAIEKKQIYRRNPSHIKECDLTDLLTHFTDAVCTTDQEPLLRKYVQTPWHEKLKIIVLDHLIPSDLNQLDYPNFKITVFIVINCK